MPNLVISFDLSDRLAASVSEVCDAFGSNASSRLEDLVSHLQDAVAGLLDAVKQVSQADQTQISDLKAQIATLQDQVAKGGLSVDEEDALAAQLDQAKADLLALQTGGGTAPTGTDTTTAGTGTDTTTAGDGTDTTTGATGEDTTGGAAAPDTGAPQPDVPPA